MGSRRLMKQSAEEGVLPSTKVTGHHYMEPYRECLANFVDLPRRLQRNQDLMDNLDERANYLMSEMGRSGDEFVESMGDASQDEKMDHLAKMMKQSLKVKGYGDDNVKIADLNCNLVSNQIRVVEAHMDKLADAINYGSAPPPPPRPATKRRRTRGRALKNTKSQYVSWKMHATQRGGSASSRDADDDDGTYCTCEGGSEGKMVGCDNREGCPIEWYHLDCLGIFSLPSESEKWFCSRECCEQAEGEDKN